MTHEMRSPAGVGTRLTWALLVLLWVSMPVMAAPLPWESWKDIRSMALVGGDSGSYLTGSYCLDGCRYDRTSVDPGLGGQRFIRTERTPAGTQAVIFEQAGAGAVTRIWMTSGDGLSKPLPSHVRIRIYFDGEDAPRIDEPLDSFFAQGVDAAPFAVPLTADRLAASGGNVAYVPLPYRKGIRIALLNGMDLRLWYQVNYTQVADAEAVESFVAPAAGWSASADLSQFLGRPLLQDWLMATHRPISRDRVRHEVMPYSGQSQQLTSNAPLTLLNQTGPGWILSARIAVPRERWDEVLIRYVFDGETTVDLPVADFFTASNPDQVRPGGIFNRVDASAAFLSSIPMPFHSSAEVSLRFRDGSSAEPLTVHSTFQLDETPPPPNAGIFHTYTHASCPSTPRVHGDQIVLRHSGAGRMIGLALWMGTDGVAGGGYYLEGDERLYIDGSVQPLWYGTGVEDMFNGGFYFDQGAWAAPLAGAPYRHPGALNDVTSMYRWFLADAPSWRSSIVFALENGPWGVEPLCLRSVAYYFALPTPTQKVLASLDVGDADSVALAGFVPGPETVCRTQTALFGDEPPTSRTARVCRGRDASRFVLSVAEPARAFRLRRTFDAGVEGQAAELWVNGEHVGGWADLQANPHRRWSQLDVDFVLAQPASSLAIEIRPLPRRVLSSQSWELWGAPPSSTP